MLNKAFSVRGCGLRFLSQRSLRRYSVVNVRFFCPSSSHIREMHIVSRAVAVSVPCVAAIQIRALIARETIRIEIQFNRPVMRNRYASPCRVVIVWRCLRCGFVCFIGNRRNKLEFPIRERNRRQQLRCRHFFRTCRRQQPTSRKGATQATKYQQIPKEIPLHLPHFFFSYRLMGLASVDCSKRFAQLYYT